MTQYNSLNVKLSNSQLNKLKSSIKNETDVVLRVSSNMAGNSNDNTNFPHELLLTNRQVANIRKAFANHSSIDIKLSKTQLSKMIQSGGFLRNLLGKLAGPLMKVAMPLAKYVLAPLGLFEQEIVFFLQKPFQKLHKKDVIRADKLFRHSSNT